MPQIAKQEHTRHAVIV